MPFLKVKLTSHIGVFKFKRDCKDKVYKCTQRAKSIFPDIFKGYTFSRFHNNHTKFFSEF